MILCLLITTSDSPKRLSALINPPSERNCPSQKLIFLCLSPYIKIVNSAPRCLYGHVKAAHYKWIRRAKGQGHNNIRSNQRKPCTVGEKNVFVTTGTRYCAIWIWIIFMHLKYFLDSKYLFEVKLKYISSVLSALNEFLRHSICSRQKCTDICEKCNALKRHQAMAVIIYRLSKDRPNGADTINKHFLETMKLWGFLSCQSMNLFTSGLMFILIVSF